jgi:Zn-dependent protease/CBS domain-containing protein
MFAHRIKLFELFGFKVQIDASWLLLAVLIMWSLAVAYFPSVVPGLSGEAYWWTAAAGLIGLAASVIIHEFAHSLVARQYAMPIKGITLFIFGGIAEMEEEPTSAKGELLMSLAGPVTSLVLAAIFFGLEQAVGPVLGGDHPFTVVVGYLAFINLVLAVFNMLPAYPLDGGRVLRAAVWARTQDIVKATRIAAATGSGLAFLLMALGVFSFITGNVVVGIWWFLIGMFIRAAAVGGLQRQVARETLSGETVERFMRRDPISVPPGLSLDRLVEDYFYRYYYKSFPVVSGSRLVGCVALDKVRRLDREQWPTQTVADVMDSCGPDNTVKRGEDASRALTMMQRTASSRLLVVEGNTLVGVLSLRDLLNYLSLRLDLEGSIERQ